MAPTLLPPVTVDDLVLRELPPDEWYLLRFAPGPLKGHPLPKSDEARILVAETPDKQIIGYWVAYLAVHMDPLWIEAEYRNRAHFLMALIGAMVTLLQQGGVQFAYAIIADGDQPQNGALAEKIGLSRLPGALYGGVLAEPVGQPAPTSPPA
jgi:hypothetical protein